MTGIANWKIGWIKYDYVKLKDSFIPLFDQKIHRLVEYKKYKIDIFGLIC